MKQSSSNELKKALASRYSDAPSGAELDQDALLTMASRGSCRRFKPDPVPVDIIHTLCAIALASPTKSDLQQRDIVVLSSETKRKHLADLVSEQDWIAQAPALLVFCGNNRRQRMLHEWHQIPFANDHIDALVNAVGDAAIALGAFVTAAEAAGFGCCPISAVRNRPTAVSELLGLPDHVFPFAGLALGYPDTPPQISKRLPLSTSVHTDSYCDTNIKASVAEYDALRTASQPYAAQRLEHILGRSENYGWSEDKVRQYSQQERADFGAYLRRIGFTLE